VARYERLRHVVEWVMPFPMRVRTSRSSRARYRARADAIETTRHTLEQARKLKAENHSTLFNVGLYLLLLDQDLADFTHNVIWATGDHKRAFVTKHEAILIYEAAKDLPQLLGRDFREAGKELKLSDAQLARLNAVSSELSKFWQRHREFLGGIRNTLAAHRDKDAIGYLREVEQLKPLEVMERAAELSAGLQRLVKVLTEIAFATAGPAAILEDMLVSGRKKRAG